MLIQPSAPRVSKKAAGGPCCAKACNTDETVISVSAKSPVVAELWPTPKAEVAGIPYTRQVVS